MDVKDPFKVRPLYHCRCVLGAGSYPRARLQDVAESKGARSGGGGLEPPDMMARSMGRSLNPTSYFTIDEDGEEDATPPRGDENQNPLIVDDTNPFDRGDTCSDKDGTEPLETADDMNPFDTDSDGDAVGSSAVEGPSEGNPFQQDEDRDGDGGDVVEVKTNPFDEDDDDDATGTVTVDDSAGKALVLVFVFACRYLS